MTGTDATAIVRAARRCLGVSFRPQGRDPATGLDCVGLAAFAYRDGVTGAVPHSYAQRGGDAAAIRSTIAALGLRTIEDESRREGDLLLLSTGPAQWHLAIRTKAGFVHADARLRRVSEVPGPPPWPIAGAWRIHNEEE